MCQICFILTLKLFALFDTFLIQYIVENIFDTLKKFDVIELKELYLLIFKV